MRIKKIALGMVLGLAALVPVGVESPAAADNGAWKCGAVTALRAETGMIQQTCLDGPGTQFRIVVLYCKYGTTCGWFASKWTDYPHAAIVEPGAPWKPQVSSGFVRQSR